MSKTRVFVTLTPQGHGTVYCRNATGTPSRTLGYVAHGSTTGMVATRSISYLPTNTISPRRPHPDRHEAAAGGSAARRCAAAAAPLSGPNGPAHHASAPRGAAQKGHRRAT